MRVRVIIENTNLDYDTVRNCWLSDFETEDYDKNSKYSFYIHINKAEDIFNIIALLGQQIIIDVICDEEIIIIPEE